MFYLRKRLGARFGAPAAAQLNLVERRNLGPKSSVVLLDVQGRRYLLGVAESSISVLDSFEAPEPAPAPTPDTEAATPRSFASVLESLRAPAAAQATVAPHDPDAAVLTDAPHREAQNAGTAQPAGAVSVAGPAAGPLAGSILSPDTWRRAVAALRPGRGA
nr:flagellar biosynthetic protein FliO [Paeniglutamicibacter psychrophenolicus]